MRTINLSDGSVAKIGVHHALFDVTCQCGEDTYVQEMRGTYVRCTFSNGEEVDAHSVCKPGDNFCKREGRRRAAANLVRKLKRNGLNKSDLRAVFANICPEYPQPGLTQDA